MSHSPKPPSLTPSRRSIFREEFTSEHTLPCLNLGQPAAENPIRDDIDSNMAASPTPREVRRLTSDHNFVLGATYPAPKRSGLWPFLANHLFITTVLIGGIIAVIVAIAYTMVTSTQLLECPPWANECHSLGLWTLENMGVIQGIITTVYLIGLYAFASTCLSLCEAALWPLLHTQPFTIRGLDGFWALTHGNIMSSPQAARSIRSVYAAFIFTICLVSIILPLTAPLLVGYAYTPTLEAVTISSNISATGSPVLNRPFTQTNPPSSEFFPASSAYTTYASEPYSEPLPDFRNWLFDRSTLASRDSFTAKAVHLQTNTSCRGQLLQQLHKTGLSWNAFKTTTNLSSNRHTPTGEVWFRPQPYLTVFLDNVEFTSNSSINTTIIFAALNGAIAGGKTSNLTLGDLDTVSAIACEVIVSASDAILTIGSRHPELASDDNLPVLSSLSQLQNLSSTLLWLTASPVLVGVSIEGSQPLFSNHSSTNLATSDLAGSNNWTIPGLENFVKLSMGTVAASLFTSSSTPSDQQQELLSVLETNKLSTERAYLLLIPPLLYILLIILTAIWITTMHRKYQIPVMRTLSLSELLKSSQTAWMKDKTGVDAAKSYLPSELGRLQVKFGVVNGEVGFGPADGVLGFTNNDKPKEEKGKAREMAGVGRGGSRVPTGNDSRVCWREVDTREYRMERGEWPRNGDL
ncbi:hypothetical protein QBC36DRAFT_351416 [Triangularia setosa]|uniref:Uncharacterized protein n=1 Tax=Triangularia setosa TaxID=2587417 RepID=A0AAN6W7K4_9PEZI|nr:hypothetical protein QBC36DRAFT_351416 [Podospora setosa]